jgi:hypothetical protein
MMKLILKEYLSSLREREELDAILPDLLSQLGLNVYSRPGRGTRQDGVDVGAVGSLDGGPEKVYLFSIKPGDLTRKDWDSDSVQSLRPSLNEIIDAYISNRLPSEHRDKDIVICICIGGDIQEQVRPQLTGFCRQNESTNLRFEEWNGDKLASLIQTSFLHEDLLPKSARSRLRKSLAMLDEPETSHRHFSELIESLSNSEAQMGKEQIRVIRQIGICLWILFAWAREAGNMESAYLSSEIALLHGWSIVKQYMGLNGKISEAAQRAFCSLIYAYRQISDEFLVTNVLPHVSKLHGVSSAVLGACSLDINLKLFDILGRLALYGIWSYWDVSNCSDEKEEGKQRDLHNVLMIIMNSVKTLITKNPALYLPIKDDQAIDISIAALLLASDEKNYDDIKKWFEVILWRASLAYEAHGQYPCILNSYSDLLSHPKSRDNHYRQNATSGSILYPLIAMWAALLADEETYRRVALFKIRHLQHCNFQLWYLGETSENHLYANSCAHGWVLSNVCVERSKDEFLTQIFGECDQSTYFDELSAVRFGFWPLIIVVCRYYRVPLPLQFVKHLKKE